MLTRDSMRGLYVLPPTPMDDRGEFCETRYRENLKTLVEAGVDAIVSPGSNGEWWSLPDRDRRRQMEILVEECQGRCVSATCTSSTSTADSIEKTRWAQQIGVDAVMNVPPFYFPLTEDELRKYYCDLA
ncbi:MAG TPA: dihydrodipicolinate synthase family protein, partial [Pirellulales bacterium]